MGLKTLNDVHMSEYMSLSLTTIFFPLFIALQKSCYRGKELSKINLLHKAKRMFLFHFVVVEVLTMTDMHSSPRLAL